MLEQLVKELRKEQRDHIKLAQVCDQAANVLSGANPRKGMVATVATASDQQFYHPSHPKRKMTAAGRRAISIAQKKRWAKVRRAA